MLSSLKNLSFTGYSQPNYVRLELGADDEEFCLPPATHFIATVEDLTDILDYGSEDIDGIDDDAGDNQEPTPIGHWTATSSYDIHGGHTQRR